MLPLARGTSSPGDEPGRAAAAGRMLGHAAYGVGLLEVADEERTNALVTLADRCESNFYASTAEDVRAQASQMSLRMPHAHPTRISHAPNACTQLTACSPPSTTRARGTASRPSCAVLGAAEASGSMWDMRAVLSRDPDGPDTSPASLASGQTAPPRAPRRVPQAAGQRGACACTCACARDAAAQWVCSTARAAQPRLTRGCAQEAVRASELLLRGWRARERHGRRGGRVVGPRASR